MGSGATVKEKFTTRLGVTNSPIDKGSNHCEVSTKAKKARKYDVRIPTRKIVAKSMMLFKPLR
jgi:hypothetical protein